MPPTSNPSETSIGIPDLTWSCMICGDQRPDALIGVAKHRYVDTDTRVEFGKNIRYCTDRPDCAAAAYHCIGCDLHPVIDGKVVGKHRELPASGTT